MDPNAASSNGEKGQQPHNNADPEWVRELASGHSTPVLEHEPSAHAPSPQVVVHPSSSAWLTAAQRDAMSFHPIPATVPPRTPNLLSRALHAVNPEVDVDKDMPETKKNEKVLIADREQIEKIQKQRKLRFSDLVTLSKPTPTPSTQTTGGWPYELILVRHGQSEGNLAVSRSEKGDLSAYTPEFKHKHSSSYRLTDKGILQAKKTGEWIRENIGDQFDRYYTSEYVRAMETAAHLGLPNGKWYTEIVLRERDKGRMDNTSAVEKNTIFKEDVDRRKRDAFFWAPPGGESLADVCIRIDHTLNTLRRECSNQRVIIVCHGEVMWAFRARIERLSQIQFARLMASKEPKDKIHNGHIIHYTRIHPQSGEIFPEFRFMRSSCPWKPEYSSDVWLEFTRPIYTNEELLESVHSVPRYVNDNASDTDDGKVNY